MTSNTNPPSLDGITLEAIVTRLSETIGWDAMGATVPVRCFTHDPSIKSSLKFLRRTPWARAKVEQLYLQQARATNDLVTLPATQSELLPPFGW
ncbi:MAG: VF530 family protein [Burkholderiales bacterium]|nr:VF530 family protein [Burkholderiales bacterium]